MNVIGIDIGFASLGWGIVELGRNDVRIVDAGCIRTKPSQKKRNVLAASDNIRRVRELDTGLVKVFERYEPRAFAAESMSWPRSSSVCAKLGMAWGVVLSLANARRLPIVIATPMEIKTALTGNGSASKEAVRQAVLDRRGFMRLAGMLDKALPKGQHEHPVDATAAIITTLESDVMLTIRQLGRGR